MMRSIFCSSSFHSKVIKLFSVTLSAYQIPYSTLKQGVTNLVQFKSYSLNTNARMYLYDTPRDTVAKDLMFQNLCLTSTWKSPGLIPNTSNFIYSCASERHAQQKGFHNSCLPELQDQQKHKHSCALIFSLNTNINYPCAPELFVQH